MKQSKIGKVRPSPKADQRKINLLVVCGLLKPHGNYFRWVKQKLNELRMKQMERYLDTTTRLDRLRAKALKQQHWETAAALQTEILITRSEYNTLKHGQTNNSTR